MNFLDIVVSPFSFSTPYAQWIAVTGLVLAFLVCGATATGLVFHFLREEKRKEKKREKQTEQADEL